MKSGGGGAQRAASIKVEYQNLRGKRSRLNLEGFLAVIFQHEYDHLEGRLFHDRMSPTSLESVRKDLEVRVDAVKTAIVCLAYCVIHCHMASLFRDVTQVMLVMLFMLVMVGRK